MKVPETDPNQMEFNFPLDLEDAMQAMWSIEVTNEIDKQIVEDLLQLSGGTMTTEATQKMDRDTDVLVERIMHLAMMNKDID